MVNRRLKAVPAAEGSDKATATAETGIVEEPVAARGKQVDRGPQCRALVAFSVVVNGCAYSFSQGAIFPAADVPFDPATMELLA